MPEHPTIRSANRFCLHPKYRNKLPKRPKGEAKCEDEFESVINCLEKTEYNREACAPFVATLDGCMKKARSTRGSSTNYHIVKMIKNKYRLPPP